MIFETLDTFGHEQVVFCHNKDAGLKAIIAIHNTVLGPALGGTAHVAVQDRGRTRSTTCCACRAA